MIVVVMVAQIGLWANKAFQLYDGGIITCTDAESTGTMVSNRVLLHYGFEALLGHIVHILEQLEPSGP